MRRTSLFFAFALSALGAGCAHTGLNSPEGWNTVKSKHVTMYSPTSQTQEETMMSLEYAYASLRSSFFRNVDITPIEVLFLEEDDFLSLMGARRDGVALAKVPGSGPLGQRGLLILKTVTRRQSTATAGPDEISRRPDTNLRRLEDMTEFDDALGQRGGGIEAEALSHLFINKMMPAAPLWFHEGFAAWARLIQFQEGGGQRVACFGRVLGGQQQYVPLKELFTTTWEHYNEGDSRAWFKHSARTLIDYFFFADGGKYREQIGGMLEQMAGGNTGPEIVLGAFPGESMDTLQVKVTALARESARSADANMMPRGQCPLAFPVPDDKAPDRGERQTEALDANALKTMIEGIRKLPARDEGYPVWYPMEIIKKAGG
jgi:hypothetical protein